MQRVHADEIRPDAASPLGKRGEVGEIADAPVRVAANRVEIRDQPEDGRVAERVVWRPASVGNDDERLLIAPLACVGRQLDANAVIPDRQHRTGSVSDSEDASA